MKLAFKVLLSCAIVPVAVNCTKDDIGEACQIKREIALPTETVTGEDPDLLVTSLDRSIDCETFKCLTYRGYDPFCTRTCSYDAKIGAVCTTDGDCKQPLHCFDGFCRDDDCPSGFECRSVQDVGPLAGKLFCVYKENCAGSNRACEALGEMECRRVGCFDQALNTTDTVAHTLTCKPQSELSFCQCSDSTASCGGEALVCTPSNVPAWPAGSVELRDVCMKTK